jgi:hypothetical protein
VVSMLGCTGAQPSFPTSHANHLSLDFDSGSGGRYSLTSNRIQKS